MASHVTRHLPRQQCHKRHMGSKLLSCFSYSPFSTKAWAFLHFPLSLRNPMFLSVSFPTTMALGRDWEFAKIVVMWGSKRASKCIFLSSSSSFSSPPSSFILQTWMCYERRRECNSSYCDPKFNLKIFFLFDEEVL